MTEQEISQRHYLEAYNEEMWTVMKPHAAFTVHVPEPDYSLLFGTMFDATGTPIRHQVEYEGDRIIMEMD